MRLNLSADELLTTTRAVRRRLDLAKPVSRELLLECAEIAFQAPTGSNMQSWHFVFVEDAEKKAALAELYGRAFDPYAATAGATYSEDDPRAAAQPRVRESARYLREHFHEVPVMLVPCSFGRLPADAPNAMHAGFWGSILPAVWSFMLAARARGLGTAWTTLHLIYEREAAEILGVPYDRVTQAGLIPVAHSIGTAFKPAPRLDASKVVHWDEW